MDNNCTLYGTMEYMAKKWTIMILLELYKGNDPWKRFSKIRDSMKQITPKVLSERLKELESEGLIMKRMDVSSFPVKTEYALTQSGLEMMDAVKSIKAWAVKWKLKNKTCSKQQCHDCIL